MLLIVCMGGFAHLISVLGCRIGNPWAGFSCNDTVGLVNLLGTIVGRR